MELRSGSIVVWTGVGLLSSLVSCNGCLRHSEGSGVAARNAAPAAIEPVEVSAARVTTRPMKRVLKFVGTLYGSEEVTLSSQVEGQIRALRADLGDRIHEGQELAAIDDSHLRARLREVEATLAKARADEARGRELASSKVISPHEYEAMKTAAAVVEAQRENLSVMIEHTRVESPLSGAVAQRLVSVGEYVRPGTPLFRLVADQTLKLRGDVPERFAEELAPDQLVEIRVDAYPDLLFMGRLSRISPSVNQESRSIAIEAIVDNREGKLKPGFFANASLVTRADEQALFVPERAVLTFAGIARVFVVRDNVAYQTLVRTGTRGTENMVEVVEGLYSDEIVVTGGAARLEHGTPLKVTRMADPNEHPLATPDRS